MHGEAGPTPWNSACWGPTHPSPSSTGHLGSYPHTLGNGLLAASKASPRPSHPDRPSCCAARPSLRNRERVSLGKAFRERCVRSRTRKVQHDFFGIGGQACDVRRQPHRAHDRQVTQQSHSEQPHGRRLDGFYGASWLVRRGAAGTVQRRRCVVGGGKREAGCAGWPSRRRSE